jgi:hypothetical protein
VSYQYEDGFGDEGFLQFDNQRIGWVEATGHDTWDRR